MKNLYRKTKNGWHISSVPTAVEKEIRKKKKETIIDYVVYFFLGIVFVFFLVYLFSPLIAK